MTTRSQQIENNIRTLENALSKGYAEVTDNGNRLVYRSVTEILKGIEYFKSLRGEASGTKPIRQIRLYGGKGY
jgi:hypothetical protein